MLMRENLSVVLRTSPLPRFRKGEPAGGRKVAAAHRNMPEGPVQQEQQPN